jgi:hypothetical protein
MTDPTATWLVDIGTRRRFARKIVAADAPTAMMAPLINIVPEGRIPLPRVLITSPPLNTAPRTAKTPISTTA